MAANLDCLLIVFNSRFQEVPLLFFLAPGFDAVNSLLKSGRGKWRSERAGAVNAALLTPRSLCFVLDSMSFDYFSKVGL